MKKWIALGMTLFFTFSVTPVVFGETGMSEGRGPEQTLIAKAKKKSSKKKKKKKKKRRTQTAHLPITFVERNSNITV